MLDTFEKAALLAGQTIMDVYRAGPNTSYKADHSPVTEADERAEAIILAELERHCPEIPVVAEESVAAGRIPDISGRSFILVDPLDGTKEFVNRRDDFTVNIALIEDGFPVLGAVYAPALSVAYLGGSGEASKLVIDGHFQVTSRQTIAARPARTPPVVVASRSHNSAETEDFLQKSGVCDIQCIGSSLKFCLLAEGIADLYPRFSRTMEWDTAAGDAVLRAAGGLTTDIHGVPLRYGKIGPYGAIDFVNPDFISRGR
ncbi:3'(2'),5'-bisphosphate nucleotidase CysQ [Rhizobium sp. XQZ8]|uniref:3'(2'),5'-bisphosphate nucleotidase CysQ n=1 Tax=Rhizobium populisoli TaxID=2859785 RepID=UPI001CA586B6|nr:3'(2'),5'-bisphosphate nucleotidase CysQ [Rhizobium populisoli]MBW6420309.1 3'(2'),5'-bisphosphate nucleotidase CysQ [Rhizobium populisoli]